MEVFNEEVIFIAADLSLDQVADFNEEDLYFFERCVIHPRTTPCELSLPSLLHLRQRYKRPIQEDEKAQEELIALSLLDKKNCSVTETARSTTYAFGADLSTYKRCIVANRATLGGFALRDVGSLLEKLAGKVTKKTAALIPGRIVGAIGDVLVQRSGVAESTYEAYRRTLLHIQKERTLDPAFAKELSETYCRRKGVELAAKEAGIDLRKAPYKV